MAAVRRKARDARASVWLAGRPSAPSRVPAPAGAEPAGLDLGKIIAVTVRLLDEEGLVKLSMRRLAAELGVTAMSVYWYVDTKDELLELALDSVYAEIELPVEDGEEDGWAAQLRQLAREHRRMLSAHPWVSRLAGEYLNVGPRAMAFVASAQRAMRRCGLPDDCLTGGMSLLFQSSYGFGAVGGRWAELCREAGMSEEECYREVLATLRSRPECTEPVAAAEAVARTRAGAGVGGAGVGGAGAGPGAGMRERDGDGSAGADESSVQRLRDRDFDFALECVLAGMASMRDRVGG